MKRPTNKQIVLGVLAIIVVLSIFFLGRLSKKQETVVLTPDETKYLRIIDSVQKAYLVKEDSIKKHYTNIEKNSVVKSKNHKKLKDEINIVENTPDNAYQQLIDSLYGSR